jgi:tryptophan synthase alpha chain
MVRRIRAHTTMPIALGFGISRPEHVAEVCTYADAAVVGSALVSVIAEGSATPDLIARVEDYVQWLRGASARNVHA